MDKLFLRELVVCLSVLALAGIAACSSTDTAKPNAAGASQVGQNGSKKQAASGISQAQTQSQSSLDALRRGEKPTTAPSSALKEVYFDFDRYDLSGDARATLKASGDWLRSNPAVRVEIEGHCDERGTSEYNLALGAKRAQAAKDYLVSLGVAPGRVSTVSYGEEIPVCREHNESCWSKNRRDRFVGSKAKPGV
ncbi:MAG: peptidoglycan-associated lipoprotein Pal [Chloroflexota bacterium]